MITFSTIEEFFDNNPIPTDYQPEKFMHISDHKKFVEGHISVLKSHPKNAHYLPYYERLLKFYEYCQTQKNQS
jgi:hypothetical protein